jgi:septal ring factor EnvC (AmiA/AmiB activator)
MRKQIHAILASLLITSIIALGMFLIGVDAVANPNGTPVLNSPTSGSTSSAAGSSDPSSASTQSQIQQLQSLVAQYQQREQQYQSELTSAQDQLNQAATTISQYKRLLEALQSRGIIAIDQNGRVFLPGG